MADGAPSIEVLQTVSKGHNGLLDPTLLPSGQAARLHNVVVRNGLAESRPKLSRIALPSEAQGRFQGAAVYELEGHLRWVVVVSGVVWTYSFLTSAWTRVGAFPTTDFAQAFFCQAGKYFIVQNGVYDPVENWPIILHGDELVDNLSVRLIYRNHWMPLSSYSLDAVDEDGNLVTIDEDGNLLPDAPATTPQAFRVPIGKAMAFGQGRLFVATERYWDNGLATGYVGWRTDDGLRNIVAGDAENSTEPDRILTFTENDLLAGGGAISPPTESGFITSMFFFRNASTGTGLGELFVLCRRGSAAYAVSTDRQTEWLKPGFGQQLFQSSGSSSPWALSPVNSDLVYYGDGGLRTIKFTASNETASGGLASVPLSPEVSNYTDKTLSEHVPFVTLANADNYVFFTAGGRVLSDGSVGFTDLLPWDLVNFQVSGETPSRVFSGAWRGPLFHAVLKVSNTQAGVVYRESQTGPLLLGVFAGDDSSLTSVVRTPAYAFKVAQNLKRLKYADLMFDRVTTALSVVVRWRVDGGAWMQSDTRTFSTTGTASTGLFRVPVEADHSGVGYLVEFAVQWTGHARLKLCIFNASVTDAFNGGEDSTCAVVALEPVAQTLSIPEE